MLISLAPCEIICRLTPAEATALNVRAARFIHSPSRPVSTHPTTATGPPVKTEVAPATAAATPVLAVTHKKSLRSTKKLFLEMLN